MLPNLCIIPDAGHQNVPQPFKKKPWYSRQLFVLFYVKKNTQGTRKIVGIFMQVKVEELPATWSKFK